MALDAAALARAAHCPASQLMPAANLAAGMGAPDYLTTEWVDSTKYHTASECEGRCFGPDGPAGS